MHTNPLEPSYAALVAERNRLAAVNAELLGALKDMVSHGTRFDMNPTMNYGGTVFDVGGRFTDYIKRIDESVRERAREALAKAGASQ